MSMGIGGPSEIDMTVCVPPAPRVKKAHWTPFSFPSSKRTVARRCIAGTVSASPTSVWTVVAFSSCSALSMVWRATSDSIRSAAVNWYETPPS